MMAFVWKMLAWFGIGVVVALGVLIVPLHVAAERKKLDATTREIAQANRDIRALETEFETRSNIAQLEKWNGETLRLAAPVAGQYVTDEAQLASLDFNHPLGTGGATVQTAALIVPQHNSAAAVPLATAAPAVVSVAVASAKPQPAAAIAAAPVKTAAVQRKAQTVAMLDRKLLSDSMIGDLTSGASREAGRLR
ncbi:hypothetical protein [Sphingomonas hylomeconis]|uniref:Uncharacterized protein n=1 Tax=Sphingomonas hylomeconis TaxID=1395958 RepID=A0ABV7SZP3_9SPHN|nr:hypothetical protein [Sphingomonas hylomeconis]